MFIYIYILVHVFVNVTLMCTCECERSGECFTHSPPLCVLEMKSYFLARFTFKFRPCRVSVKYRLTHYLVINVYQPLCCHQSSSSTIVHLTARKCPVRCPGQARWPAERAIDPRQTRCRHSQREWRREKWMRASLLRPASYSPSIVLVSISSPTLSLSPSDTHTHSHTLPQLFLLSCLLLCSNINIPVLQSHKQEK